MTRSLMPFLLACLIATPGLAQAASVYQPITYGFQATLDHPINGTDQVTGSFTWLDTSLHDPVMNQGVSSGNDIAMTLDIAGHSTTIHVANPFTPSTSGGEFRVAPQWQSSHDLVQVVAYTTQNTTDTAYFGQKVSMLFKLDDPSGTAISRYSPGYLQEFDLSKFATHAFTFGFGPDAAGNSKGGSATITSLQFGTSPPTFATPTPEPSGLVVLTLGGLAVLARKRVGRPRAGSD